jgi:hypothetical protein
MLGLQYTGMALRHWKEWCPSLYRELKKDGTLNKAAQDASKNAARQVAELMQAGARQDEAEEIVLRELILLPPEEEWSWPRGRSKKTVRTVRL